MAYQTVGKKRPLALRAAPKSSRPRGVILVQPSAFNLDNNLPNLSLLFQAGQRLRCFVEQERAGNDGSNVVLFDKLDEPRFHLFAPSTNDASDWAHNMLA